MEQTSSNSYESLIITPDVDIALKDFLKMQKRYPVIAITWPAWVGKSTITKLIADYLWAKLYTELPDNNPFLKVIKNTYWKVNDITLWGNNQNYFLATDVWEIVKAFIEAKVSPIVFDFALTQPFIFSDINLKWNWLKSFKSMYEQQFNSLPKPDIVLELKADSSVIINRLAQRWKHIDDFVITMTQKLNSYYDSWIVEEHYTWGDTKVLFFDNSVSAISDEAKKKIVNNILDQIKKVS